VCESDSSRGASRPTRVRLVLQKIVEQWRYRMGFEIGVFFD